MTNFTATLHAHSTDPDALVLKTPIEIASEMGRFAPARYDRETRGYLLHVDHLDALRRFAKTIGLHIIDQRQAPPGDKPLMPECGNCGQPAALTRQPDHCPTCGRRWKPVFIRGTETRDPLTKACVRCGHTQGRRWAYCIRCGQSMPDDPPEWNVVHHVDLPRPKLDEPMPFSECIEETLDVIDNRDEEAS